MEPNPYAATSTSPGGPPPFGATAAKPASITVFGIINIVWGAFGICGLAGTSAMLFFPFPQDPRFPNPALELLESNQGYRAFLIGSLVVGVVATVILIIAGVGLLKSRRWGRSLSIGWAWYAIASMIIGLIGNWFFLWKPLLADAGPGQGAAAAGLLGGILGSVLGFIYPILLHVFLNKQAVSDALT